MKLFAYSKQASVSQISQVALVSAMALVALVFSATSLAAEDDPLQGRVALLEQRLVELRGQVDRNQDAISQGPKTQASTPTRSGETRVPLWERISREGP
jgi:hypothetical protein